MTQRSARADRWVAEAARLRRWLDSVEQMCDNPDTEGDSVIGYNAERLASESPSGVQAPSLSSRVIR